MTSQIIIRRYLLDVADREVCEREAARINHEIYQSTHRSGVYGYGKAVCRLNPEGEKWRVRVMTAFSEGVVDPMSGQHAERCIDEIRGDLTKFSNLLAVVRDVIDKVQNCSSSVVNPAELNRKLQKLLINLLLARQWPYGDRTPFTAVAQKFQEFAGFFSTKNLTPVNQAQFNRFVSQFNKHVRRETTMLDDFSEKIITKLNRSPLVRTALFERIQQLIREGTERILWPDRSSYNSVLVFCKVMARCAYVYKPDADIAAARELLQRAIDRLLLLVVELDHENKDSILSTFTMDLLESITRGMDEGMPMVELAPMVWVLQALVQNPPAISYLRFAKRSRDQETRGIDQVSSSLLTHELTWKPISQYLIALGDIRLFEAVIIKKINIDEGRASIPQDHFIEIFAQLVDRYHRERELILREDREANVGLKKNYAQMIQRFLTRLAEASRLHDLKPYAEHPAHFTQLRSTLSDVGFEVMRTETVELALLFSNPAYRALGCRDMDRGIQVRRALLHLFTKFGSSRVSDQESFERALRGVIEDFNTEFYSFFAEEVFSQVGRSSISGISNINEWLEQTVVPIYRDLKKYVVFCLPIKWHRKAFEDRDNSNLVGRICLYDGGVYSIHIEGGKIVLKDLFTNVPIENISSTVFEYSESFEGVKQRLKTLMEEATNRTAISNLAEQYMPCVYHENTRTLIEALLKLLFEKMKKDHQTSFSGRIHILSNFLKDVSPFLNSLVQKVKNRFFPQGIMKLKLVLNLRGEAAKPKNGFSIGAELASLREDSPPTPYSDTIAKEIHALVSLFCIQEVKEIVEKCSLLELTTVVSQFNAIVSRKLDELSYTVEDFTTVFHQRNQPRVEADKKLDVILADLPIRGTIMEEFGSFLKARMPPVNFILPNQAIAIRLCQAEAFAERNLLLKLGTGQGKSIVIAVATLLEAKKPDLPGRVFVFTSYDYLARRDHELGQKFFEKDNISSICISSLEDISRFGRGTKIVYADIEKIDTIIREIMILLLENRATDNQKLFLQAIYSAGNKENSIILDEYDLLLYDLEEKQPYGMRIPNLSTRVVRDNSRYCSWLPDCIEEARTSNVVDNSEHLDPATGKPFSYVKWHEFNRGFHLKVSVTRLSSLMKKAKRVIGLSGTAESKQSHGLSTPLFFELPASQNPQAFETVIQRDEAVPATEFQYIARQTVRELPALTKANPRDPYYTVNTSLVQDYCDAIIADVKKTQEPKQNNNVEYRRPVMIFVDPTIRYKSSHAGPPVRLWDTLKAKMIASGIHTIGELQEEVSDAQLQEVVSRSGKVTLATIKFGRGADIRVHEDIVEGLHVIIGTNVIHERVLDQLIGRTGRMGRAGSYSIFTFGNVKQPPSEETHCSSEFYGAIHELTRLFVNRVIREGSCSEVLRARWMMFITYCCSTVGLNNKPWEKISKQQALELCGVREISADLVPAKFWQ